MPQTCPDSLKSAYREHENDVLVGSEILFRQPARATGGSGRLFPSCPVAILGKSGMIPYRVIQVEPNQPSEQNIVVNVLDESPLTADRVKDLKQGL